MTDPQDPFAAPEPGSTPPPPAPGSQPPPPPYGAAPYGSPQPYGAPPPYGAPAPYGTPMPGGRRNGMGTASLVLGIVSIACTAAIVIPGVLAVVFGVQGRRRAAKGEASNGGMALAGIITGGISLVMAAGFWIVIATQWGPISDYMDCMSAADANPAAERVCEDQLEDSLFQ